MQEQISSFSDPATLLTRSRRRGWCLGRDDATTDAAAKGRPLDHRPILAGLARMLKSPEAELARRAYGSSVSRAAILAVAAADLLVADRDTLRSVATSHATCAKLASRIQKRSRPWSWKVAQRARKVLAALGLQAERHRGRRLRLDECRAARAAHGRTQTMAASTRDWTLPASFLGAIVHQPATPVVPTVTSTKNLSKRAKARATAGKNREAAASRSLAVQRFAAKLVQRLPWLDQGHIGKVCRIVVGLGIDVDRWTVQDLLTAMDDARSQLGWIEDPGKISNRVGHFIRSARFAIRLAVAQQREPQRPQPTSRPQPAVVDAGSAAPTAEQLRTDADWVAARAAFFGAARRTSTAPDRPDAATPTQRPEQAARAAARRELAHARACQNRAGREGH